MTRAIYVGPWRVDLTVRDGVVPPVPGAVLARAIAAAIEAAGAPSPAAVGLILSDDAELAALNAAHLGKTGPTDVLSFPLLAPGAFPEHPGGPDRGTGPTDDFALPPGRRPHLGEIVVSVERAIEQAEAGRGGQTGDVRWSPADELRLLGDARRPPPLRLGPRRTGRGGRDAGPRSGVLPRRTRRRRAQRPWPSRAVGRPGWYHRSGPSRDGIGPCRAVCGGSLEGRRGSREPWVAVRRDAPQRRLAGDGPARRTGRLDRQGPPARRVERRHGPLPRPRPDPRQAAHLHERLGARRAQGPGPRPCAAERPPHRGRRLRAAVRQAALPRGRRPRRSQRPALDHRGARHREVQPAAGRDRRARPRGHRSRPDPLRARRAATARRAARRRRRCGRGLGARGDEQGRQPLQHVRAPTGRHDPAGGRGRGRWPARRRRDPPDQGPDGAASGRPSRTTEPCPIPPLRGRRGRDRRIAERVATDFAARHAPPAPEAEVDFDIGAVDAEVADARRPPPKSKPPAKVAAGTTAEPARKGGHRLPDLSALPPLLAATGTFEALRERLGRPDEEPGRTGRHVGLVAVPHGAKSYLAADPGPGRRRRAPGLDRPGCRDRRSRRRGTGRLAGRPRCRRRPRAADRARLRAQRADRR